MAKKRAHKQSKRSLADVERHRARLRKRLPSEYWVEQAVHGVEPLPTGWITCALCRIPYPSYYVATGVCEDCRLANMKRSIRDLLPSSNWAPLVQGGF